MHRSILAAALLMAIPASGGAQTLSEDPKVRCEQLMAFWLRHGGARGEGSTGTGMALKSAAVDCQAGRYRSGIATMEELLRRNDYTVPQT
jgi:hypothetical protein